MTTLKKSLLLKGIPASGGFAFGEARIIFKWVQSIEEHLIPESQVDNEIEKLDNAVDETLVELEKWRKSAGQKIGGPVAKIFDSQMMIASDREFLKRVKEEIKSDRKNAEYVYSRLIEETVSPLRVSPDPYMRQMVYDIEAVSQRIINHLAGLGKHQEAVFPPDCVFVAKEFTPGEVLSLYERKAAAIVTTGGSAVTHMALIARSLLIPAVVGVEQAHLKIKSGDRVVVDGDEGIVRVNLPAEEWSELRRRKAKLTGRHIERLQKLPQFPPRTADNKEIELAANIDLPGPIDDILASKKIGVGLYRTEFLYLQNGKFPSEDQQFEVYDRVAARYHPQAVVIRTFDLGSDKYFSDDRQLRESNPALGWRGIRAALDMPKIFRDQLRAILRASKRGNIRILLPMIADIAELRKAMSLLRRSMVDLRKEKMAFDQEIKVGVMIEVPSAAVAAEALAERVSFFSIGSNDLTQYTLAADRDNERLAKIFNPLHPAVLRLIKLSIDAARSHNIPIAVCGEMSGDPLNIPLLVGMGINQLSMNPSRLFNACLIVSKMRCDDAERLADEVLRMKNLKEVEGRLLEYNMSLQ